MKGRRLRLDRISALPRDIIEKILTHMPVRDALRTSILSKKWRYRWTRMPKLVFDDYMFEGSSIIVDDSFEFKLVKAMFHVLLLHRGPVSEFSLCVEYTDIVNEIDMIILHLSWSKNIKKFIFECVVGYKLPRSFFSLQELELLDLRFCKFKLPLMFNGFRKLKSLRFFQVEITVKMLQRFLTGCPLLEEFTLIRYDDMNFLRGRKFTFVELFKCLPAVKTVIISRFYIKHFTAGGMPQKLPTSLVHLRTLVLAVCFLEQDEVSSTLYVINSSPNLEKIEMQMIDNGEQTFTILLDLQDYSDLNLDHLKELEITSFHNYAPEMEFVKLIMAKSPQLKKARIELNSDVSLDEENFMLRELLFLPFPRASPTANFIIERP